MSRPNRTGEEGFASPVAKVDRTGTGEGQSLGRPVSVQFMCYINSMTSERRGRGRPPREGGPKESRSVRIDSDLWDALGRIARAHGLTASQVVEAALFEVQERHRSLLAVWEGATADLPGYEGWRIDLPPTELPGLLPHLIAPDGSGSVSLDWALAQITAGSSSPAETLRRTAAALDSR